MIREDYLLRLIRQFFEALARIVRQRETGQLVEAQRGIDRLYDELGIPRDLIPVADSTTLADMLGRGDKIRACAHLLVEEGHLIKAKGDPLGATQNYRRALELFLEARAREPVQPDDDNAILELSRIVPAQHLAPRYRGIDEP